ncbi:MAG: helix-turn-helix transcriptional regulator [Lachnospiraceae bacterium]|nr:helix-turn-helix transcriptional regulator [Lachnospiraceae bacterium]
MSLTNMIQYDDECKSFFKMNSPQKNEFKTLSEKKPFSKDYEPIAEYTLGNPYYSSVVGTAFDYIARWIVAKNVSRNREAAYEDLIAERGLAACAYAAKEKKIDLVKKYKDAILMCKEFVEGERTINEIIKVSVFCAKLEHAHRMVIRPFDVDIEYILSCEEEIVKDLDNLVKVFEQKFVISGLITNESKIVYNPTFGGASVICGGADADIYIDGTLYDFKCTKKTGYAWNESAQLLGYFLLDVIAKKYKDSDDCLNGYDIKRIAIYRARYGEIEFVDIQDKHYKLADKFEELLGNESYKNYLKEERERIEKGQIEKERFELEYSKTEKQYNKLIEYTKCEFYNEGIDSYRDSETRMRYMKCVIHSCYDKQANNKIDGNKLKQMMEKCNISIDVLEEKINRKKETIKNWLEEKTNPSAGIIIDLSEIFECEIIDIVKILDSKKKVKGSRKKNRKRRK